MRWKETHRPDHAPQLLEHRLDGEKSVHPIAQGIGLILCPLCLGPLRHVRDQELIAG